MSWKDRFALWRKNEVVRLALFGLGCFFLLITPVIGPLPGPGGLVTFGIGAGLVLQNSAWAKRRYVELKRKSPKAGSWADWSLRRQSAKRRDERAKLKATVEGPLPEPGGLVTFGIGAGAVRQNSAWAKRRYVEFKRKSPKAGSWVDWGLRRQSAKRRDERAKLKATDD